MNFRLRRIWLVMAAMATLIGAVSAQAADTTPAAQLARFNAQADRPGQAETGRVFFQSRHGADWSCASCHGSPPSGQGKHASTGKSIAPLAPAFNPQAFTDTAKVDKWLRRNCKDVASRECTAQEKADLLAYLVSVKP